MRVRALSPTGDMTFGQGSLNYYANLPITVAQVVQTSLKLWLGEWYLNINAGTPWLEGVVGKHDEQTADLTIQTQIANSQGVVSLNTYSSTINPTTRQYSSIAAGLQTQYGPTEVQIELQGDF